jgi:catechol 2,3-dioxygenase-like lactoylglutathione lyase family enzyme
MIKINETNVTIMVRNLDESIKFYESIGLKLKQRWGNHYAMFVVKGITLGLHPFIAYPKSHIPHRVTRYD